MTPRPLPPAATYSVSQVAARFGLSADRWKEMRADLEARGFPLPIVETSFVRRGTNVRVRRALWSRRQVDDWLDGLPPIEARVIELRRSLSGCGDPELAERAKRLAGSL